MNHDTDTPIEPGFDPDAAPAEAAQGTPAGDAVSTDETMQAATARIEALEAELAEMKDRWMRSEAEMQNLRARSRREIDDARQYAVQKFARDVVEAAENMQRGISSLPAAAEDEDGLIAKLREGFYSIERSFVGVLERHGIAGQDPVGAPFDANLHQAMAEQPSADHAPGTVIQAWTPAWTLHGRLLKPAMVVVAKAAPPNDMAKAAPPNDMAKAAPEGAPQAAAGLDREA